MGWRRRLAAIAGTSLTVLLTAVPLAAAHTTATSTTTVVVLPSTPITATPTTTTTPTSSATPTTAQHDPFAPVTPPPGSAASANAAIFDFGFSPATLTVAVGTTVTWTNTGASIHSITSDTGAFDSSPSCPTGSCIDPGGSYSHQFAQAGTFAYHCKVHPNMTGTVVVNAPPTTTTTARGATTTVAGANGDPPVSDGGGAGPTVAPQSTGNELAFTGASSAVLWLAFVAIATIALGFALRPRRRPFPDPVSDRP